MSLVDLEINVEVYLDREDLIAIEIASRSKQHFYDIENCIRTPHFDCEAERHGFDLSISSSARLCTTT